MNTMGQTGSGSVNQTYPPGHDQGHDQGRKDHDPPGALPESGTSQARQAVRRSGVAHDARPGAADQRARAVLSRGRARAGEAERGRRNVLST